MKTLLHPGRLLQADIEALGLSVAEAARGLGVNRQQLSNVLNGKSAISPEMAVCLEQGIGSTAETWLNLQVAYDLAQTRARVGELKIKRLTSKPLMTNSSLS